MDRAVAVIGAGTIGGAIIRGLLRAGGGYRVVATARSSSTVERLRGLGVEATTDNVEAVREADLVILTVKPYVVADVLREVAAELEGKPLVSLAAAVSTGYIASRAPKAKVIRGMTNINVEVNEGFTTLSAGPNCDQAARSAAEELFRRLGTVEWVDERYMDALTALSGSAPAFIAEVIDALALGGIAAGLPRDLAYRATLMAMMGTSRNLLETGRPPHQVRDMVLTPAGTTIRGVMVLQGNGLKRTLMEAVLEATRRAKEMRDEMGLS
ncbi:pyrroline-5-carboxylate reductase [Acidilobus saccharovorans 345-15]|uniref:Pyrroline-5-carboxylate reductase n=1 Tax=Acidilobus saccharovorans (strain DSM 16705 / JCM 18335 / VKM B-2471 / 345-15) TaxID=666510 RepID=D9PZF7_ACIS3|nr:pyrroline-5-carboxylate reductase [Acidilobus saccharovorans]ADL18445.1 pyrroline-5-carboxylate reductase [Acidilobus saccharovorans 345-15]